MRTFICCLLFGVVISVLRAADPGPSIIAIFPSGHELPANHLKFYLHFSEPMRQGVFLDHCRLLDAHGSPVLEPFRETELWSEDGKRLTLWLHPGRQKTGVNLNDEFGPVLRPHERYTLVISGRWSSDRGVVLGQDQKKEFITVERAVAQLDISKWMITEPSAGTLKPLEVTFPAPLDHALLQRCLRVADPDHKEVAGTPVTVAFERTWRFTPAKPWNAGPHELIAESILEDLAGNSLARPFEVDLTGPPPRKTPSSVSARFVVK